MSWIWRQQVSQCLLLLLLSVSFGLEADEIAHQEHDEQRSPTSNYLRIVGGHDVVDSTNSDGTRYGFFVSLVDQDYRHQCGGTLVAPDMVLTSSHCSSLNLSYAMVGRQWMNNPIDPGMEVLEVSSVRYPHPNYDKEHRSMDQLLLKLEGVVARHEPIKLPLDRELYEKVEFALGTIDDSSQEDSTLFLLGAGQTDPSEFSPPDVVQRLDVDYIPNAQCSTTESRSEGVSYSGKILEDMICVQSSLGSNVRAGQCFGDSGGPLILKISSEDELLLQIGIISWGGGRDCGAPDVPGVSSRVSAGMDFLWSTICDVSRIPPAYLQCGGSGGLTINEDETDDEDAAAVPESSTSTSTSTSNSNIMYNGSLESSTGTSKPTSQGVGGSDISSQSYYPESTESEGDTGITPVAIDSIEQPIDGSSHSDCLLGTFLRFRKCDPSNR